MEINNIINYNRKNIKSEQRKDIVIDMCIWVRNI